MRNSLKEKIEQTVTLLQKAERLALSYDPEDGYHLAFSGGKDSQALYHVAKLAGVKFKAHMNLTSVDPPEVIRFVKRNYPDVELVKPKASIYSLAIKKGMLPTMFARWCCAEFKEDAGAGKVTLTGVRRQESVRRSVRNPVEISDHKFSGDLQGLDEYRETLNDRQKANKLSILTAEGERTVGCISGKETLIINPILSWTEKDVWEFLNENHIEHCELYDQGYTRIGCLACPMRTKAGILRDFERYPHVRRRWLQTIKEMLSKDRGAAITLLDMLPRGISLDQQAEYYLDWWISKKKMRQWAFEQFRELRLDFGEDETDQEQQTK